ncbi:hypothetical protein SDC9_131522 [bioreactor metagenome]|uniref:Uncharacterized protein n=1 Tax=bioreactor metagenome TaxID=1076179 RepID=A0A645D4P0_9ZZZZ
MGNRENQGIAFARAGVGGQLVETFEHAVAVAVGQLERFAVGKAPVGAARHGGVEVAVDARGCERLRHGIVVDDHVDGVKEHRQRAVVIDPDRAEAAARGGDGRGLQRVVVRAPASGCVPGAVGDFVVVSVIGRIAHFRRECDGQGIPAVLTRDRLHGVAVHGCFVAREVAREVVLGFRPTRVDRGIRGNSGGKVERRGHGRVGIPAGERKAGADGIRGNRRRTARVNRERFDGAFRAFVVQIERNLERGGFRCWSFRRGGSGASREHRECHQRRQHESQRLDNLFVHIVSSFLFVSEMR